MSEGIAKQRIVVSAIFVMALIGISVAYAQDRGTGATSNSPVDSREDFASINMNGKLDTNALGIPKKGYGFSNNAKKILGTPTFASASFLYDGQNVDLTMSLNY